MTQAALVEMTFLPATAQLAITPSLICQTTALAQQQQALNLAEGLPDFAPPTFLQEALLQTLKMHTQQTAAPQGELALRQAMSLWLQHRQGLTYCPQQELLVTAGATEGFYLACASLLNPDDEVILLAPFYECYLPVLQSLRAKIKIIPLSEGDWRLDEAKLKQALSDKTKLLILTSPGNPAGQVHSQDELLLIAKLAEQYPFWLLSDEVYNHLVYPQSGYPVAPSPAQIESLKPRTLVLNSLSKTFSATGWRIGLAAGNSGWLNTMATLHEVTTGGTASPMQSAAIAAFQVPNAYYSQLQDSFWQRWQAMVNLLDALDIQNITAPEGAYYGWVNVASLGYTSSVSFCEEMIHRHGLAFVPGSAFLPEPSPYAGTWVRVCFAKKLSTLEAALQRVIAR
jgi:aspartate/methionine/tyrosine aminotransferase